MNVSPQRSLLAAIMVLSTTRTVSSFGPGSLYDTQVSRPGKSIVELALATPDLSTLVAALKAADLVDTLSGPGPFTVFAPTNEAFAKLPPIYLQLLLDPNNVKTLQKVLTYHVVSGTAAFSKNLKNGEKITTVEGQDVTVTVARRVFKTDIVKINDASVTTADVAASNGVVHIIDTVLMPPDMPPPDAPKNIVELALATPDLSTLAAALKAADLVTALSEPGPFTVFAPTNEAFAALPAGVLARLLKPKNKKELVKVLAYHVVSGKAIYSTGLAKGATTSTKAVEGGTVSIFRPCTDRKCNKGSRLFINPLQNASTCVNGNYRTCYEAQVSSKDNSATNGVVHIIDSVLLVPN